MNCKCSYSFIGEIDMSKHKHLKPHHGGFHFPSSLLDFRRGMDHLFDDFFRDSQMALPNIEAPKCNISETEKAYHIEVQLPGMSAKDVDLSLDNNVLTIKGEHKSESENKDKNYHSREFSTMSIQRSWELPKNVNADGLHAAFESGILKIDLPKSKAGNVTKKIEIKDNN